MRRLWLPILIALGIPALAQNPQCPTRALGDKTNACASTAFVSNAITAFPIGTNYWTLSGTDIYNANAGNVSVGTSSHTGAKFNVTGGYASFVRGGMTLFVNPNFAAGNVFGNVSMNSADNMDFSISADDSHSEYFYMKHNGRVGFNTISPGGQVDVSNTSTTVPTVRATATSNAGAAGVEWIQTGTTAFNWSIPQNGATYANKFVLSYSGGSYPGTPLLGSDLNGNIALLANQYLNFGTTFGSGGYGLHSNSGAMQYKNSGGSWVNICQPGNICGVDYGVNCDGSTSMNTPLTNAINAVNTANATSPIGLYLPPGVCMVTPDSLPVLTASLYGPDTVFKSNSNVAGCLLTTKYLSKAPSITNDVYPTTFNFGGFVSSQTAAPGNETGLCIQGAIHTWFYVRKSILFVSGVLIDLTVDLTAQFTENYMMLKLDANTDGLHFTTSLGSTGFSVDANVFDLQTSYNNFRSIVYSDVGNIKGLTSNIFYLADVEIGQPNSFGVIFKGFSSGNILYTSAMRGKNGSGKYLSFDALACANTVVAPILSSWVGADFTNLCVAGVPDFNHYIIGSTVMP